MVQHDGSGAGAAGAGGAARGVARPIELFPSRALLALFLLFGLAFIVYGVGFAGGLVPERGVEARAPSERALLGAIPIVAGAVLLLLFLPQVSSPRPVLVADERGLHYLPRFGRPLDVAWSHVVAIARVRAGKSSAIGVWVRDRDAWFELRPAWMRPLLRARCAFGGPEARFVALADRRSLERFAADVAAAHGIELR